MQVQAASRLLSCEKPAIFFAAWTKCAITMQTLGNVTFSQAVLNVVNIVTGVGLLSVPFALKRAGWAGLGILWMWGFVLNYTGGLIW